MKFSHAFCAGVAAALLLNVSQATAARETVVYAFCNPGSVCPSEPYAGALIEVHGKLYGTTGAGGQFQHGTLFEFDPATRRMAVLHSFGGNGDGSGANGLLHVDGMFYGTTVVGGAFGKGTVFSFDLKTKSETVLHSFGGNGDGANPEMTVPVKAGGLLYGATAYGGAYGFGSVFSVDPGTGAETVLHSFQMNGSDGVSPWTGPTDSHGLLYGTTVWGGTGNQCAGYGCGTLYAIDPQNGAYAVLHSFQGGADDVEPMASLLAYKGMLYGTGLGGPGVFSFDPQTQTETMIKDSQIASGSIGALIGGNGKLYGTNPSAHKHIRGDVYEVNLRTGAGRAIYGFRDNGSDGSEPYAGLVEANGVLYGTTRLGGAGYSGTIFAVKP